MKRAGLTAFGRLALLAFLIVIALPLSLLGATTGDARPARLRNITTSDRLSDLLVNDIFKDSHGYLWFGTERALDRFDGNQIRSFPFPGESAASNRINAIAETADGTIWVGNNNGLYYLDPESAQLRRVLPKKITARVNALAPGEGNTLYIGTRQGLFIYDTKTHALAHKMVHPDAMDAENEVNELLFDRREGLILLMPRTLGLLPKDDGNMICIPMPTDAAARHLARSGNTLFVGTEGDGVVSFDLRRRSFGQPVALGNNIVTALCIDGDILLAGTDGEGIFEYSLPERRVIRHFTASSDSEMQLRSNSVYSMLVDDNGLLWIGYYQSGVEYTPSANTLFSTYAHGDVDTRRYAVRSLAVDGPRMLIGTQDGLLYIDESTGRTARIHKPEIDSNLIFSIAAWRGKYYIATYFGGMYVFDPATSAVSRFCPQLGAATVFCIERDGNDNLWIGTSQGVYRFADTSGKPAQIFSSANSQLPPGNVYEIFFDSMGRGWFCTEKGMALWNGYSLQSSGFPQGFINQKKIRVVYEDTDHNLYFAPDRGEVCVSNLELTRFRTLDNSIGGNDFMTTAIIEDSEGKLWFGTDRGLFRSVGGKSFMAFNNADGVLNPVFTLCKPVRLPDGDILFGTTKGLLRLDFSRFAEDAKGRNPHIRISDIASNGRSIMTRLRSDGKIPLISLTEKETDVAVSITDFSYADPEFAEVQYRLDGVDKNWRLGSAREPIHYYDLAPGNYTLRVRLPGDEASETRLEIRHSSGFPFVILMLIIAVACLAVGGFAIAAIRRRHRRQLSEMHSIMERGCCRTSSNKIKQKPQLSQAEAFLCP